MSNSENMKKFLIRGLFCVSFLTLAQATGNALLIYAALFLYLATVLSAKEAYVLPLFLFFLPWSTILKPAPTSISFCSIAIILVLLVFLLKSKKIRIGLVLPVISIVLVTVLAKIIHNYNITSSYIMFLLMLLFSLTVPSHSDNIDFEVCTVFFTVGIITATITASLFASNSNMFEYIKVFEQEDIGITRLCGFYGDPNFYAAQVVTAIGCMLVIINHKKKGVLINVLLVASLIACGLTSVSKSFVICLAEVFAVWLFTVLLERPSKFIKFLFGVLVLITVALASGVFSETIDEYLIRFGMATDTSALTTGRNELWIDYLKFLWDHPIDLLLGQGYTNVFNTVRKGSHNTIIQCLYQLGILGSIAFAFLFAKLMKAAGVKKTSVPYIVLFGVTCFSMWIGLDMMFFDDFFLTLFLFAIGIKYVNQNAQDRRPVLQCGRLCAPERCAD